MRNREVATKDMVPTPATQGGHVPYIPKEEVATLLLLVINCGLNIYEIYGVPSYGLPRGKKRLAVIGCKYPLSLVDQW